MNACQRPHPGVWLLLAATLAVTVGTSAADDEPRSATALASAAKQAYAAHEFRRAGELFEQAIQRGAKTPVAPYDSACSYAHAGVRRCDISGYLLRHRRDERRRHIDAERAGDGRRSRPTHAARSSTTPRGLR